MKRILILIIGLFGVAYAQYAPTSAKTKFVNGISIGSKDSTYFTNAGDTIVLYIGRDSAVYARYKGYHKRLAYAGGTDFVPYTGAVTNVNLGNYRLTARSLRTDSIYANGSGGLHLLSNSGSQVALFGAGGGTGTTLYGGLNGTSANWSNVTTYDSTAKFFKRVIVSPTGNSYFQDFGINEDGPSYYSNRNIDGGTDINEHGFIDATTFKNRTNRAYNSYDAQPRIAGSANLDHLANFQSRGDISLTGGATISNYWSFLSAPSVTSGNITNLYHFQNFATVGSANVSNEYGLYITQLRASRKYGIYVATDSVFVGNQVEATKFKVTGGTSSQFLKADGSVDGTAYGTGTVTSVSAGTGMSFTTITSTGAVNADTTVLATRAYAAGLDVGKANTSLNNVNGVLSSTYGGAGSVSGILKANGSGVVSAASAGDIPNLSGTYVDLTTNQTVGGIKTLTSQLNGTSLSMSGIGLFNGATDDGTNKLIVNGGVKFNGNILLTGSGNQSLGFGGSTTSGAASAMIYSDQNYVVINSKAGHRLFLNGDNTNASSLVDFFNGKATVNKDGAATFSSSVYGQGYRFAYAAKSSNYTLTDNDDYINVTASCTITLPTAVGRSGKRYVIKCTGSAVATIASTSSQTIDGNTASTYTFGGPNFNIMIVYSDGSNWFLEAWQTGI